MLHSSGKWKEKINKMFNFRFLPKDIYRNKAHCALVIVTLVLCVSGFMWNTYETFEKFISRARLVLTVSQSELQLPLPVFVLCNHLAYKELPYERTKGNKSIWLEDRYLEQTRDPSDLFRNEIWNGKEKRLNYTTQELHTALHGRCLAIYVHTQVRDY